VQKHGKNQQKEPLERTFLVTELSHEDVRRSLPVDKFEFESTDYLTPLDEIIGQERGLSALLFGLELKARGYNVYVAGPSGTGKKTAIINFLRDMAKTMPVPPDWCYVNNFEEPRRPKAIKIPTGKGAEFKENMDWFVQHVIETLMKAFSSEEYAEMRKATLKKIEGRRDKIIEAMRRTALNEGFSLQSSPVGLMLLPIVEGRPIDEEEFGQLPKESQDAIQRRREALDQKMRNFLKQFAELEKRADAAVEQLNRGVANSSMEHHFQMMNELYEDIHQVSEFLEDVKDDILVNLPIILNEDEESDPIEDIINRYKVNLLVDNSRLKGAPVVTEPHPTHRHIFGYLEKEAKYGTLTTDFTLIRGGSAHRANGGFLIVTVEDLFADPYVWGSLKRAIRDERLEIEDVPEPMELMTTKTLMPEPIHFDTKVILIGETAHYFRLEELDGDFEELFKVRADFDTTMKRNEENIRKYCRFVKSICEKENLKPMDRSAVAAIVEFGSRLASDQKKLSTRFREIADFIIEVGYYTVKDGAEMSSKRHVDMALEQRLYRSNLYQEKLEEMIARGVLLVDTEGTKVGQVNGLAVLSTGNYEFGKPSRVTASVGVGKEGIIDIEREADLSGPIHTKGVLILSGYLNEMYAQERPLSLAARIVFEQSYSGIEGDSASSTELYAILSALSDKPIKQHIAVTGSVNQKGEVQAIGGVNEKIEGFYEVCKAKDLNGKQGVIIPTSNVDNLMLKEEVVEAVRQGKFHIYAVRTVNEGIEILTGFKAGEKQPDGSYEAGTINDLVQRRLSEMAERIREYSK